MQDLDPDLLARLRRIARSRADGAGSSLRPDDALDASLRLFVVEDGRPVPTVTGMLLAGREGRIAALMPSARSSFRVFEGTGLRMSDEGFGPLPDLIDRYEAYVSAWNPERETGDGTTVPDFSPAAFREGIVNAFCHRDYSAPGVVSVAIDDEGLTIGSSGGFPEGVGPGNVLSADPVRRNPALADAMRRLGLAEGTGRGVGRIFEGSAMYGRPWPDYSESGGGAVRLFIPRARADLPFARLVAAERVRRGRAISVASLMVLSALNGRGRLTAGSIAGTTTLGRGKVLAALAGLAEAGLVSVAGDGGGRTYALGPAAPEGRAGDAPPGIPPDAETERVAELAGTRGGIVTKQDVADLLGTTPVRAYAVIRRMQRDGRLELVYGGKYAKYRSVPR